MDQDITESTQPESFDQPQENLPVKKDYLSKAKAYFKVALIISLFLAPILLIVFIVSGVNKNEGNEQAGWLFLVPVVPFIYAVPILLILGLINAILYARDKKKIK